MLPGSGILHMRVPRGGDSQARAVGVLKLIAGQGAINQFQVVRFELCKGNSVVYFKA